MAMTPLALPSTMKAWVRQWRGPPRKSLILMDLPVPDLRTGASTDVLIRVSYVALQFNSEFMIKALPTFSFTGNWIPELELSGQVVATGDDLGPMVHPVGSNVVAFQNISNLIRGRGILAEYVRLPSSQVAYLDDAVDMESASGVIGAGCTALKMIRLAGGIRQNHTVLVNGASGSVGSVLVQLCKLHGATVVGVASGGNEALVRSFGADEFIDYQKHSTLPTYLAQAYGEKPFDFVMDCVGVQPLYVNSPAYLKPEGAVINIGLMNGILSTSLTLLSNLWLPAWLGGVPRRYIFFSTPPSHDDAVYLSQLLGEGLLRVPVDSIFDLSDALRAYERVFSKRARGKVVIRLRSGQS